MKGKRKPTPPVEYSESFECITCNDRKILNKQEVREHLIQVHNVKRLKGKKAMRLHLDCADSFTSTFEWDIGGVQLVQCVVCPRNKPWQGAPV